MRNQQILGTRLGLHLTQQQLRFVELLEMNAQELDEAVERELADNPALEVLDPEAEADKRREDETPVYLRYARQSDPDARDVEFAPPDQSESLYDHLRMQISQRHLPADVAALAEYIIGNLDGNGYLRRSPAGMADDIAIARGVEVAPQLMDRALEEVRRLEPAGVGAENLRESLLLQLKRLPESEARDDARRILQDYFDAFTMRHSHRIISGLHLSRERLDAANSLILTLNPKPGGAYGGAESTAAGVIVPDYIVSRESGELYISLNNRIPELAIGESFREAMRGIELKAGRPRKGTEFIRDRYRSASDFINTLRQRQQTMLDVMTAIVNHQRAYFESGDVYALKPMMLKDIERITGYDKSVISRATNNKYVSMPWGAVMPLRSFFSDTVGSVEKRPPSSDSEADGESDGGELTNRQIEAALCELVAAEDKKHPLSDEKLRCELLARGYEVSRRTVAKYRDRAGILVARLRKEF